MPWRIIGQVLNNEQVIQKVTLFHSGSPLQLAESAPIRAAAKVIVRGASSVEEKITSLQFEQKARRFSKVFKEEYQKALVDKSQK